MPEREVTDELIERIAAELREMPVVDRGLDARVMAEIAALPPHQPGAVLGALRWLRRPITLRLSPLRVVALAAGLSLLVWLARDKTETADVASLTPAAAPGVLVARHGTTMVQFVLVAPEARNVVLVGDFNDWDPAATPLHRAPSGGAWTAALPLQPGRHRYAFVVDGVRWMADPTAPPAPDDDFGSPGSVVTVGA